MNFGYGGEGVDVLPQHHSDLIQLRTSYNSSVTDSRTVYHSYILCRCVRTQTQDETVLLTTGCPFREGVVAKCSDRGGKGFVQGSGTSYSCKSPLCKTSNIYTVTLINDLLLIR